VGSLPFALVNGRSRQTATAAVIGVDRRQCMAGSHNGNESCNSQPQRATNARNAVNYVRALSLVRLREEKGSVCGLGMLHQREGLVPEVFN
jgi:hypothetical protein